MRSERPFGRSVIKLAVRLALGRSRSHFQDWLPSLRLADTSAAGQSDIVYHGRRILTAREFRGTSSSEPIYIIGSGPSVSDTSIEAVPDNCSFLLNGAISLVGNRIGKPMAVVIEDERFIWRHFDLLRAKITPGIKCIFSLSVIRSICEHDSGWLADKDLVVIRNGLAPYAQKRLSLADIQDLNWIYSRQGRGMSLDPDLGIVPAGTVAATAMQFALATGSKNIGLIGIDISNSALPRFYENNDSSAFSGIALAEARILDFFGVAKQYSDENGITLRCYSSVSALLKIGYEYSDDLKLN
jgi:hypothetical protein